jgi:hypothetical protein
VVLRLFPDALDGGDPVDAGQAEVRYEDIRLENGGDADRVFSLPGGDHRKPEALQNVREHAEEVQLVVHQEQALGAFIRLFGGTHIWSYPALRFEKPARPTIARSTYGSEDQVCEALS